MMNKTNYNTKNSLEEYYINVHIKYRNSIGEEIRDICLNNFKKEIHLIGNLHQNSFMIKFFNQCSEICFKGN